MEPVPATSPVYAYLKRASMVDYPGHLAVVAFTSGCNFRCGFCHNAALLGARRKGLPWSKLNDALQTFRANWTDAVCVTGGEPTLWGDHLTVLVHFLRERGFLVKLDTNGSRPGVLERVLPLIDRISMDVKCSLQHYADFVHFGDSDAIARSIALIKSSGTDHEFRTTVVPGFHTEEEMARIGELVKGAQLFTMQPFLPRPDLPDPRLREIRRTSTVYLRQLREILRDAADRIEIRGCE